MNRLGELERAIMEVLWEAPDPMTVRQVGTCLTDRDLAHTTVMTVLDRLAKKGFARRQRAGRADQVRQERVGRRGGGTPGRARGPERERQELISRGRCGPARYGRDRLRCRRAPAGQR